jgi:DNA adenine methylase
MKKRASPLRYPGGKAILTPVISSLIETNGFSDQCYAEPFAGGAGAALELLFSKRVRKILLNDADYHLYAFWQSVITETGQFCAEIKKIPLTVAQWRKQKEVFNNISEHSLFAVGFATFYLNRTNRSGILNGAPIGGFAQTGIWKIDARFNRDGLAERIKQIALYKDRVQIFNLEAQDFLKYLNSLSTPIFVYLDPPYYKQGPNLYLNFYKHDDHAALSQYIQRDFKHPWLLSYDDVGEIRALYKNLPHIDFELAYHANLHKTGKEVLFLSPNLNSISLKFTSD